MKLLAIHHDRNISHQINLNPANQLALINAYVNKGYKTEFDKESCIVKLSKTYGKGVDMEGIFQEALNKPQYLTFKKVPIGISANIKGDSGSLTIVICGDNLIIDNRNGCDGDDFLTVFKKNEDIDYEFLIPHNMIKAMHGYVNFLTLIEASMKVVTRNRGKPTRHVIAVDPNDFDLKNALESVGYKECSDDMNLIYMARVYNPEPKEI